MKTPSTRQAISLFAVGGLMLAFFTAAIMTIPWKVSLTIIAVSTLIMMINDVVEYFADNDDDIDNSGL